MGLNQPETRSRSYNEAREPCRGAPPQAKTIPKSNNVNTNIYILSGIRTVWPPRRFVLTEVSTKRIDIEMVFKFAEEKDFKFGEDKCNRDGVFIVSSVLLNLNTVLLIR